MNAEQLKKRFLDLFRTAYERDIPLHTHFLTLEEQELFLSLVSEMRGARVVLSGGYECAERKAAFFFPSYLDEAEAVPPLACLEVRPAAERFAEELGHRDVLGALMSLGIERDRTGDIIIRGKSAFIVCLPEIADFIADQLTGIRHTKVICARAELPEELLKPVIEDRTGSVAQPRLDAVLGMAFHLSRGTAQETIAAGYVFINGRQEMSGRKLLKDGDLISVRHRGKFIFRGISGESKKGRVFATIGLYR